MSGRKGIGGLLVALVMWLAGSAAGAQVLSAEGRVRSVTVYRGQALVSREVELDLPAGTSEVVVSPLPEQVVGESLFVEAADGASVQAVRYRRQAVEEQPREEVRALEARLKELGQKLEKNRLLKEAAQKRAAYLDNLERFTPPTADAELRQGVLRAEELKQLSEFIFAEREGLAERSFELAQEERQLKEQMELVRRKLSELTRGASRTVHEAVVALHADGGGPARLRLCYLVRGAGWGPTYTVHADGHGGNIRVSYGAAVYQMSGEDWEDVDLTLSTASPTLRSRGPELAPLWVRLSPVSGAAKQQVSGGLRQGAVVEKLRAAAQQQQAARTARESLETAWEMNVVANQLQSMELAGRSVPPPWRRPREGLSATYGLSGRVSVPSRSDVQMVGIADLELPADYYFVARPVLSGFVYREALVTNNSTTPLLEGPASVYLDGEFVGKTELPMVAVGQKFSVGLGIDSQLRTSRELVERKEERFGANKRITARYRLSLENFKGEPAKVRLCDRIPHPLEGAELRVTLGEMSHGLSDDPLYQQRERPKGILRWDVEVPAGVSGSEAFSVDYSYIVEFDARLELAPGVPADLVIARAREMARRAAAEVAGKAAPGVPKAAEEQVRELRAEFDELVRQKQTAQ